MRSYRNYTIFALGLMLSAYLFVTAFRLLAPSRNWFGNPNSERKVLECSVPGSNAVVRLYHGYHSSITGRDWTSVTNQPNEEQLEKQFFYSYGAPFISEVACKDESVFLEFGPNFAITYEFSISEIETQLTRRLEDLRYGEREIAAIQPLRILKISFALALFAVGAGILFLFAVKIIKSTKSFDKTRNQFPSGDSN